MCFYRSGPNTQRFYYKAFSTSFHCSQAHSSKYKTLGELSRKIIVIDCFYAYKPRHFERGNWVLILREERNLGHSNTAHCV